MRALGRVRAFGAQFALLAVLAMVAALLIGAAPRVANRLMDQGLRADVAAQPPAVRDLVYEELAYPGDPSETPVAGGEGKLETLHRAMPPAVRRLVGERWYAAQVGPRGLSATGRDLHPELLRVEFGLRTVTGAADAVRMVAGHWPRTPEQGPPGPRLVQAAISERVAAILRIKLGARFRLEPGTLGVGHVDVVIVGIFAPTDPAAGIWQSLPPMLDAAAPTSGEGPYQALALTDPTGLTAVQNLHWQVGHSWHYRVDPQRLSAGELEPAISGLLRLHRERPPLARFTTSLEPALQRFADELRSVRALLAVVAAGVLATLAGLMALAAALASERRRAEIALLRARGGSLSAMAGRSLAESLLVVPLAAAVGWLAAGAVPGRPGETGAALLLATAVAVLVLPVTVVAVARRANPATVRRDLVTARPSLRRITAESSVLLIAALGAFLLRRRGLSGQSGVDPYLVSVPVLLAAGAAVLALRAYPWPLRQVARLAGRARGLVPFLGVARAGRAGTTPTGPVTVLVVAIATAMFSAVVAGGIADGRDRAAERAVPGDVLMTGDAFPPQTADELARLAGVRAVARIAAEGGQPLRPTAQPGGADLDEVSVLVVDGPALARVAAASGVAAGVPAALATPASTGGPAPALVSPAVAADLPGHGFTTLRGQRQEFAVAGVVSSFPLIAPEVERFVVLPWEAIAAPSRQPLAPTGFVLAGADVDPAAVREIGERGQRELAGAGPIRAIAPPKPTSVLRRADHRQALDAGGVNNLLSFGFGLGAVGGIVLGLLAIAFAVVGGAAERVRLLARLRTLGLTRRQWRGLLAYELAPPIGVALGTGAVVGVALPVLLGPVLQLSRFADGVPVGVRVDVRVLGVVLALALLGLVTAIAVEVTANRRLRSAEALRQAEGS